MNMHAFAIDSDERKIVPLFLAAASIAAAFAVYWVSESLRVPIPWWIDTPSVFAFYVACFSPSSTELYGEDRCFGNLD